MSLNQNIPDLKSRAIRLQTGAKRGILAVHSDRSVLEAAARGILGGVHANATVGGERAGAGKVIDQFRADLDEQLKAIVSMKHGTDDRFKAVQDGIDDLNARIAAAKLGAGDSGPGPVDPDYTKNFQAWVRGGEKNYEANQHLHEANSAGPRREIQASMSVGTPADGGYLAPTEWDRKIITALAPLSPMRRLATVVTTGVNAFTTLWNLKGWGSGWVGETAGRTETVGATFAPITFASGEIYANVAATQRLLDDAEIKLDQFIADGVEATFAAQEDIAFVSGNGTNKPYGFLTFATGAANAGVHPGGAIAVKTLASASAITGDELIDHFYGLTAPYRQNSTWLMNSATAGVIAKLKDGQGNYLWREAFLVGQPATILGRPVEIDENMPSIAAGAIPIAFGDFKAGYLINDRNGLRVLRDPYTNKPYVMFYCTKRVGGGLRDPNALRVMKMAAS